MSESELYERLGRMQAALEQAQRNFDTVLGVLANVKAGRIDIGEVVINLETGFLQAPAPSEDKEPNVNGRKKPAKAG